MLHKLRLWLIRKLVGKTPVILNVNIKQGTVYVRGEKPLVKLNVFDNCVIRSVPERLWRGGHW